MEVCGKGSNLSISIFPMLKREQAFWCQHQTGPSLTCTVLHYYIITSYELLESPFLCTLNRRISSGLSLVVQVRVKVNSVPAEHFQIQITSVLPFGSFFPGSWVPFPGCSSWNWFRTVRADITNSLICTEQGSKELPLHSRLIFLIRIPWWATAYSSVKACIASLLPNGFSK